MQTKGTHYILIDHENIKSLEMGDITELPVKVLIFFSGQSKRPSFEELKIIHKHAGKIRLIEIEGSGKNALDFHIAYYAGRIDVEDPEAFIHIITKDKGFDPLIAHLNSRLDHVKRLESVSQIHIFKKTTTPTANPKNQMEQAAEHLLKNPAKSRPRTRKRLASFINGRFGKKLSDIELDAIISELVKAGTLEIGDKEIVSYHV